MISHKMGLFGNCGFPICPSHIYGSLSDNFFVIHASLYYRHLLVLALLVNFAFYQQ